MMPGCYALDLYCENYDETNLGVHEWNEFPHQFTHEFGAVCRANARKRGWRLFPKFDIAYCPKCVTIGNVKIPRGTNMNNATYRMKK